MCGDPLSGQKAPSAKRCIKTQAGLALARLLVFLVRKHRAPKGALRLLDVVVFMHPTHESESTERQKVH